MTRGELKGFFADVCIGLNMNLGPFCDRNHIYRSEFSNFMKDHYNHVKDEDLEQMKDDIMEHLTNS